MCLDHPQRVLGGLYHCAKFGCNRRCSFQYIFQYMGVSILFQCLKITTHAHFGSFLLGWGKNRGSGKLFELFVVLSLQKCNNLALASNGKNRLYRLASAIEQSLGVRKKGEKIKKTRESNIVFIHVPLVRLLLALTCGLTSQT